MKTLLQLMLFAGLANPVFCQTEIKGFTLLGDPENPKGAEWTCQETVNGIYYNLTGMLFRPAGKGPFPAVILNHASGTSAELICADLGPEMKKWGYAVIATNYTYANSSIPEGSPGSRGSGRNSSGDGAKHPDMLRAMKCWEILKSLNYVDTNCIAAFGHSAGAFLTIRLVSYYGYKFCVAGHTAGGVRKGSKPPFPDYELASKIRIPYIIHQGAKDDKVKPETAMALDSILSANHVSHEYCLYPDAGHGIPRDSVLYSRTRNFFRKYMCKNLSGILPQ